MSRSNKMLLLLLSAMCVLVLYQNCGQSKSERETPLDDKVHKINDTQVATDSSDDELLAEIQKLTIGASDEVALGIESCKRSMGSDRRDCLWDKITRFYAFLKNSRGYTVSNELAGCFLAVSKSSAMHGTPIDIISTCKSDDLARAHRHVVNLDECVARPSIGNTTAVRSAVLNYRSSRFFEHARSSVAYLVSSNKKVEVFVRDANGSDFTDACGVTFKRNIINLFQSVQIN